MEKLPGDVVRLVLAAREIAFGGYIPSDVPALKELDSASEAFAARVPWPDEPEEDSDADSPFTATNPFGEK